MLEGVTQQRILAQVQCEPRANVRDVAQRCDAQPKAFPGMVMHGGYATEDGSGKVPCGEQETMACA